MSTDSIETGFIHTRPIAFLILFEKVSDWTFRFFENFRGI